MWRTVRQLALTVILLLVFLSAGGVAQATVIYQYDDGSTEGGVGEGDPNWDWFWLNRYSRQAGGEVLRQLDICFYNWMPTNASFRAIVWNDSGSVGDPADARVARSVDATATGTGDRWVSVAIPDTLVTPSFFVGAYIAQGIGGWPAGVDVSNWAPGRSYGGGTYGAPSDLDHLTSNEDHGWYEQFGIQMVNMVRATGEAQAEIPEPASLSLLALGALSLLRRRRARKS